MSETEVFNESTVTGGEEQSFDISSDLIRGHINTIILRSLYDGDKYGYDIINEMNITVKYEGYLKQQQEEIDKFKKNEATIIPAEFDYKKYHGLRLEAAEKLQEIRPLNIGQASRISGVSPADIAVLSVLVKKFCEENKGEK